MIVKSFIDPDGDTWTLGKVRVIWGGAKFIKVMYIRNWLVLEEGVLWTKACNLTVVNNCPAYVDDADIVNIKGDDIVE